MTDSTPRHVPSPSSDADYRRSAAAEWVSTGHVTIRLSADAQARVDQIVAEDRAEQGQAPVREPVVLVRKMTPAELAGFDARTIAKPYREQPASALPNVSVRQQEVWRFIAIFIAREGMAPTVREIQAGMRMSSTSVVEYALSRLIDAGAITRRPGRSRSLTVRVLPPGLSRDDLAALTEGLGVAAA